MNKDQKILNSINIYNGITKMFNWYINPKNEFTEKDKYRSILALLSTHFLFLKENIIEKKENLNNVSLLHENILESLFTDVLKSFSTIEEYKNLPLTTSVAISIIRNKFAHGDFLYDEINKFVMINLEGEKIKLDIDKLLDFYVNIELGLHQFYKGNTYERNILLNKTKCIIKKPLKTEKEFEEAIKLFTLKTYKLKKNDNEMVSLEMKKILDNFIYFCKIENNQTDIKNYEEKLRKMFEKNGYSLAIENKKIKNKEHIEKIKESFLTNKTIQMLEKNSDAFTYTYGELISKIIFKNDMQTEKSGLFNLVILANKLNSQNYEEFSLRLNALNLRNEIIASILLARFNLAYCYPLDDIYKKDNNYHLDREELLDFSKLDLSEFNPKVLNINKNGLKNAYIQLESNINEIIELKEKISKITNQIQNLEKDEIKKIEKKEILLKLKESLDKMTEKVNEMKEKRVENINYYNEVLKDYEDNYLYFKNLAIIEGIRNSIAHGNVEIINSSLVDNFNNLEIRFYDEYQGKIFFDLTTNLYNFQSLFEEYNISFLRNYQQKILDGNNVKMKVC